MTITQPRHRVRTAGLWLPLSSRAMTLERSIKDALSLALREPGEVILAARSAGWMAAPPHLSAIKHGNHPTHPWLLHIPWANTVYSTSSYSKMGYKYKLLHNNCTKTCFFFRPRRKWGWYGDSTAITHSLIERQRLDTLSACRLKRKRRAWLPDWMGL